MQRRPALAFALYAAALGDTFAQARRTSRVAFVEAGSATANAHFVEAFRSGMRELGYVEGRSLALDVRWAEGQGERFTRHFAELLNLDPDVLVVASSLGAVTAKKSVTKLPVVFVGVSDPVGLGLVANLARPGGNFTGLSRVFDGGLLGKSLQLLKEVAPSASRVAYLWNAVGGVELQVQQTLRAMQVLGLQPFSVEVREPSDFEDAFARMRKQSIGGLLVITDPLTLQHRVRIVTLAAALRVPAVYEFAEFARAGGLISYSASVPALFRRAATYVDKILRGTPAGNLPVEQPTRFDLVVNLKTARALGLSIPRAVLLSADEVIE